MPPGLLEVLRILRILNSPNRKRHPKESTMLGPEVLGMNDFRQIAREIPQRIFSEEHLMWPRVNFGVASSLSKISQRGGTCCETL